eukprot:scaffold12418_cov127-Isochrysis_galbana.AAC.1
MGSWHRWRPMPSPSRAKLPPHPRLIMAYVSGVSAAGFESATVFGDPCGNAGCNFSKPPKAAASMTRCRSALSSSVSANEHPTAKAVKEP